MNYSTGQEYGDSPPSVGLSKVSTLSTKDYMLPVIDVDKQRRNFPCYEVNQYFTLQDIITGDTEGTTDTDAETHGPQYDKPSGEFQSTSGGYTKTYKAYKNATRKRGGTIGSIKALGTGR